MIVCRPCNLIFGTVDHLHGHQKTDYHKMVEKGFSPSIGKFFCYLCWRGYSHKLDLREHYAGGSHEQQVKKQSVLAIYINLKLTPEEEEEEERRKKEQSKRQEKYELKRSTSSSSSSRKANNPKERSISPVSHSKSNKRESDRDRDRDRHISKRIVNFCVECNLVFISDRSETLHRESQRHKAVLEKKRPLAPSGKETPFVCYLCWWSYDSLAKLHEHYDSEEHVQRLKRYGVERLLLDSRLDKVERSVSPPPDSLEDFILVDMVNGNASESDKKAKKQDESGKSDKNQDESGKSDQTHKSVASSEKETMKLHEKEEEKEPSNDKVDDNHDKQANKKNETEGLDKEEPMEQETLAT